MYMYIALCMVCIFGNYRSSYVMAKNEQRVEHHGNKGIVLKETRVHTDHVSQHIWAAT